MFKVLRELTICFVSEKQSDMAISTTMYWKDHIVHRGGGN